MAYIHYISSIQEWSVFHTAWSLRNVCLALGFSIILITYKTPTQIEFQGKNSNKNKIKKNAMNIGDDYSVINLFPIYISNAVGTHNSAIM